MLLAMKLTRDLILITRGRYAARSGEGAAIRHASGLTLAEVATAIGATPSAVCKWERGDRLPRSDFARRYAQLLAALDQENGSRRDREAQAA